jgi:hypothetical protein
MCGSGGSLEPTRVVRVTALPPLGRQRRNSIRSTDLKTFSTTTAMVLALPFTLRISVGASSWENFKVMYGVDTVSIRERARGGGEMWEDSL